VNLLGCIKRSCYSPTPVTEFSWFESVPSVSSLTSVFSPVNAENICGNSLYHQPVTNQLKKFSFLKGIVAWPWKFATSVARTSSAHCAAAPCLHPATWKCPAGCRIFMRSPIFMEYFMVHGSYKKSYAFNHHLPEIDQTFTVITIICPSFAHHLPIIFWMFIWVSISDNLRNHQWICYTRKRIHSYHERCGQMLPVKSC